MLISTQGSLCLGRTTSKPSLALEYTCTGDAGADLDDRSFATYIIRLILSGSRAEGHDAGKPFWGCSA